MRAPDSAAAWSQTMESSSSSSDHEIGHVELGHCRRSMTYAKRAGDLAGGVGANAVQIICRATSTGYSEDQEFACDAWSHDALRKLGVPKSAATGFLKKLAAHQPKSDEKSDSKGGGR